MIASLFWSVWPSQWYLTYSPEAPFNYVLFWIVPTIIVGVLAFAVITYYLKSPTSRETLCRKCGHILRGITEPRCPECGERI